MSGSYLVLWALPSDAERAEAVHVPLVLANVAFDKL